MLWYNGSSVLAVKELLYMDWHHPTDLFGTSPCASHAMQSNLKWAVSPAHMPSDTPEVGLLFTGEG